MSAAVTRMPGSGRNRTAACLKTPAGRSSGIRPGPTGRPPSSGDSRAINHGSRTWILLQGPGNP